MGEILDDQSLTDVGLLASGKGRVLLLACGALAREILALKALNNWTHMDLRCLPAKLHMNPEKITPAVVAAIEAERDNYEQIYVVYADCGTAGALAKRCAELAVDLVPGPHCYSFFDGNETFEARGDTEMRAFYLTDFLVRQFESFFWKPMGLDRHPELRDMLFGNYEKLIYLAQTRDKALEVKARECAEKLALAYEYRFTGYGDLAVEMARLG